MAYAFVQQKEASAGSGSVASIASGNFTASLTAGNLLWFVVTYTSASAKTVTYTDTLGNNAGFTEVGNLYNAGDLIGIRWGYCKNILGGTDSVTATFSASITWPGIYVAEYSGLDTTAPYQTTVAGGNRQAAPGTGTDAVTSTNLTPSAQPAVLIGFSENFTNGDNFPTAGTGFTSRTNVWNFGFSNGSSRPEDKRLTATSAVAATFTSASASDVYYTVAAVFSEAGVGATKAPPPYTNRYIQLLSF